MWILYHRKEFPVPFCFWKCDACGYILMEEDPNKEPSDICPRCKKDHSKKEGVCDEQVR